MAADQVNAPNAAQPAPPPPPPDPNQYDRANWDQAARDAQAQGQAGDTTNKQQADAAAQAAQDDRAAHDHAKPAGAPPDKPTSLLDDDPASNPANCINQAAGVARNGQDDVVFLHDSGSKADGVGHVVAQDRATGVVTDPAALGGQVTYKSLCDYEQKVGQNDPGHSYTEEARATADSVHQILALPPGERAAAISGQVPQLQGVENHLYAPDGDIEMGNIFDDLTPGRVALGVAGAAVSATGSALGQVGAAVMSNTVAFAKGIPSLLGQGLYTAGVPFLAVGQATGLINVDPAQQPPSINSPIKFDRDAAIGVGLAGSFAGSALATALGRQLGGPNLPATIGTGVAGGALAALNLGFGRDAQFNARAALNGGALMPAAYNFARYTVNAGYSAGLGVATAALTKYAQRKGIDTPPALAPVPGSNSNVTLGTATPGNGTDDVAPGDGPSRGLKSVDGLDTGGQSDARLISGKVNDVIQEMRADPAQSSQLDKVLAAPGGLDLVAQGVTHEAASRAAVDQANTQLSEFKQQDPAAYSDYVAKVAPFEASYQAGTKAVLDADKDGSDKLTTALNSYTAANPNGTFSQFAASLSPDDKVAFQHDADLIGGGLGTMSTALQNGLSAWQDKVVTTGSSGDVQDISALAGRIVSSGSKDDAAVNYAELRKGLEAQGLKVDPSNGELEHLIKDVYNPGGSGALDADQVGDMLRDGGLTIKDGHATLEPSAPALSASLAQRLVANSPAYSQIGRAVDAKDIGNAFSDAGLKLNANASLQNALGQAYGIPLDGSTRLTTAGMQAMLRDGAIRFNGSSFDVNPNAPALTRPLAQSIVAAGSKDDAYVNYKEFRKGLEAQGFKVNISDGDLESLLKSDWGGGGIGALSVDQVQAVLARNDIFDQGGSLNTVENNELR